MSRKAFLKWAGGKSRSLSLIESEVYSSNTLFSELRIGRFIEPFVGSGVVFLNIEADEYIINDINKDLTNLYETIKTNGDKFISECKKLFTSGVNNEEDYYNLRIKFNNTEDVLDRSVLFMYLNRHCFNGLCRYNKSGEFNVPFGRYNSVHFPEKALNTAINRLDKATIYNKSFEKVIALAEADDVVYCDPPYVPISDTASFTDYTSDGFTMGQQKLLAKIAEESRCKFLISNHDTEITRELYKNADYIIDKKVNRFISAKASSRVQVSELLAVYERN